MGHITDHTIIVSGVHAGLLLAAHTQAANHFQDLVSPIVRAGRNNHAAFFVAPDGSKDNWPVDEAAAARSRDDFVHWLRGAGRGLRWVEVVYNDSDAGAEIVRHHLDGSPPPPDIVERLRIALTSPLPLDACGHKHIVETCNEAADLIADLRHRLFALDAL